MEEQHNERILEQFTHQAKPFADAPEHSAEDTLRLLVDALEVIPEDEVLDVACGPGIVGCAVAAMARKVTGIDLVPAMIEQARKRQAEKRLNNVSWQTGDAIRLPFDDGSFSLVVTRYSFHHLIDPGVVLREMIRVCRPGGRVAVADVTPEASKKQAYDELEKMRDPSHVHALSFAELEALGTGLGLRLRRTVSFRLDSPMEPMLANSLSPEGNAARIRELVRADIGVNRFSIGAFEYQGAIYYSFPTTVMVWNKPGLVNLEIDARS